MDILFPTKKTSELLIPYNPTWSQTYSNSRFRNRQFSEPLIHFSIKVFQDALKQDITRTDLINDFLPLHNCPNSLQIYF